MIPSQTGKLSCSARRFAHLFLLLALVAGLLTPALAPTTAMAQDSTPEVDPAQPQTDASADAVDAAVAATPAALLPGAVTATVVLPASQDSFLSSAFPDQRFGSSPNLNLGWQTGGQNAMRIVLQFDLSSIPRNAVINSARWEMFQSQVIPVNDGNMDFRAQFMTQSWREGDVTWNNANFLGGQALPLGSVPGNIGVQSGDARGVVQSWLSGAQPNFGVIITGDEEPSRGRWRVFRSRESGDAPRLVVNFTANCDNVPPTATLQALPTFSPGTFRVFWTGQDFAPSGCQPSGIATFDVDYRINGGSWIRWRNSTTGTDFGFRNLAANGAFVEFRARATDNAGNIGQFTPAQASTTVDSQPPSATMAPLAPIQTTSSFVVNWSGTDNLSGIVAYDVEFQVDNGPWQPLISETLSTSFQVTGAQAPQQYGFRVRATDAVGNVQPWSATPQAETTVLNYPVVIQNPIVPNVIGPSAPVTDTIRLSWRGVAAPGTTIQQFNVYYTYNLAPRKLWQSFNGSVTSAVFPWEQLGLGDGGYNFDVTAVNNLGQETSLTSPLAALGRQGVVVDMADIFRPRLYFGFISGD